MSVAEGNERVRTHASCAGGFDCRSNDVTFLDRAALSSRTSLRHIPVELADARDRAPMRSVLRERMLRGRSQANSLKPVVRSPIPSKESRINMPEAGEVDFRNAPEMLTPKEVARLCGVTPKTIAQWAKAGKIGSIATIGGHRRYWKTEIDLLVRATKGEPSQVTSRSYPGATLP